MIRVDGEYPATVGKAQREWADAGKQVGDARGAAASETTSRASTISPSAVACRNTAGGTAPHRREVLTSFRCKVFREPRYFGSRSEIQIRPRPQRVHTMRETFFSGDSDG